MVNHAAVAELLKEAEMMARLRHPNIVWVYGVVLPPPDEQEAADDEDDFDTPLPGEGPFEIGAACAQVSSRMASLAVLAFVSCCCRSKPGH